MTGKTPSSQECWECDCKTCKGVGMIPRGCFLKDCPDCPKEPHLVAQGQRYDSNKKEWFFARESLTPPLQDSKETPKCLVHNRENCQDEECLCSCGAVNPRVKTISHHQDCPAYLAGYKTVSHKETPTVKEAVVTSNCRTYCGVACPNHKYPYKAGEVEWNDKSMDGEPKCTSDKHYFPPELLKGRCRCGRTPFRREEIDPFMNNTTPPPEPLQELERLVDYSIPFCTDTPAGEGAKKEFIQHLLAWRDTHLLKHRMFLAGPVSQLIGYASAAPIDKQYGNRLKEIAEETQSKLADLLGEE